MNETSQRPKVELSRMTDEHADSVSEFFRAVWDPQATGDSVRRGKIATAADNPFFPGEDAPTFLFFSESRVIGFVSSIPVVLWSPPEEHRAYWVKGLMVLPEYRNGPIGFYLVKELVRQLPCALSLTVSSGSRRLFEGLGFSNLGILPNYLFLLQPARVLQQVNLEAFRPAGLPGWLSAGAKVAQISPLATILGYCASGTMRVKSAFTVPSWRHLQVSWSDEIPDPLELNRLWSDIRNQLPAAPVRDGRYIPWRYGSREAGKYKSVMVHEGATLRGWAVVRKPREEGDPRLKDIRVATLSDLLFSPARANVAAALITGAEKAARELRADAILCSASHPSILTALSKHGFLRVPGNLHFLFRHAGAIRSLPNSLSHWWLSRGDMNADEVF